MTHTHKHERDLVQRLAEAARVLPDEQRAEFVRRVAETVGPPITATRLAAIRKPEVAACLGERLLDDDRLELVRSILAGERPCADAPMPVAYVDGQMPGSLRLAIASNSGDALDGHFGSCARFLIYQVSADESRLVDVRSTVACERAEDRNAARAGLRANCHLVYVQSIGGPAAAKLARAGVHPIKWPAGSSSSAAIARLQASIHAPPPWLARAMGVDAASLARFAAEVQA